ncbi:ankyrin repeat domain-containing protein [Ramlibacter humi]|uniref:Ankyrin repeat domain-containing protein n=1 Tax=Ramlibacter humi TaxID=2530451 RepID=A0A4Z0BM67_9BURK|nr:ankyrin repeat domain-containing protein [Ramlibacter humi]TFY99028.1 ankyrin repeat domain-containing protein [Ramlibacter humi]
MPFGNLLGGRRSFCLLALAGALRATGAEANAGMLNAEMFAAGPAREMARAIVEGDDAAVLSMARSGQISLLERGRNGAAFLSLAIAARRRRAFEILLEHGALGDPAGPIAGNALYAATVQPTLYFLERLHHAGADLNNRGGGELLLAVAMNTRRREVLDFYLARGADLERPTTTGGTVALYAADVERFDLVNEFLDRGASPWVMDSMGTTIGYAAQEPAATASWVHGSPMDRQRVALLARLRALGFPFPPPTPDQGHALRQAGAWPPAGAAQQRPR